MALTGDIAFGHIIPKYAVQLVDLEVLKHCVERTVEKVEKIILDWKGIRGSDKAKLMEILDEVGLPIEKV